MLCPFCQHELDQEAMRCPRCGAEYPVSGAGFGLRLRTVAIATVTMTVVSLILVNCVLNALPGSISPSLPPNMRSAEVQREMLMRQHHQQDSQNPGAPPAH